MKNRIGFFEEYDGKLSYQRLQSIVLLSLFCFITLYEVYKDIIHFELLVLLLAGAVAPKLVQKFTEQNGGTK